MCVRVNVLASHLLTLLEKLSLFQTILSEVKSHREYSRVLTARLKKMLTDKKTHAFFSSEYPLSAF